MGVNNNCDILDIDPREYFGLTVQKEEVTESWLCPFCLHDVGEHFMNPCENKKCSSLTSKKLSYNITNLNLNQGVIYAKN